MHVSKTLPIFVRPDVAFGVPKIRPLAKSPSFRRWWILFGLFVTFVGLLALIFFVYVRAVYFPFQATGQARLFTITQGASVDTITQQLQRQGYISHPLIFRFYVRLSGATSALQAGDFQLPQQISMVGLVQRLEVAHAAEVSLRFTEGWRREEMAEYITKQQQSLKLHTITGDAFATLAKDPSPALSKLLNNGSAEGTSLQGFLFPDTYLVSPTDSTEQLLKRMVTNYRDKVTPAMVHQFSTQGLTEYEAITMASIVEREGRSVEEKHMIAGILLARLKNGMVLGVDATLQYVLGYSQAEQRWWRQGITVQDLALDSPYNTRLHVGLPPHPICNPGLAAIEAVAQPQASTYVYYLHDAQGVIHYATTLSEHEANIARYLP
jgi:UPF0755 protein